VGHRSLINNRKYRGCWLKDKAKPKFSVKIECFSLNYNFRTTNCSFARLIGFGWRLKEIANSTPIYMQTRGNQSLLPHHKLDHAFKQAG
jgi:hypothetical protein